ARKREPARRRRRRGRCLGDAAPSCLRARPGPGRQQIMRQGRGRARGSDERRAAFRRGRWGERAALWWLRLKGYRILAQDYRSPAGEIDVVARRGSTLAIIEVKARDSVAAAVEAIMPRQRNRIFNA